MIDAGEVKKGITIELDGGLHTVVDFQHIKVGRGGAQIRLRLKDIKAGHTIERVFQATERFNQVRLEQRQAQYLYNDGDLYYFMDTETFEQTPLSGEQLGDILNYLKEEMMVQISKHGENAIGVELPIAVALEVTETGPSFKGDTSSGGTKPAVLETGITVQVPFFVNIGDRIKVDTRSGNYIERA